jgi:hypothetical protein
VDVGHYAGGAAALVNADLSSLEEFRDQLDGRPTLRERATDGDLRVLRRFVADLGTVIDDSAAGREREVVHALNALLDRHPLRPRISGHDGTNWHVHVNDRSDPVAAILIGEALYGMTLAVTEYGADRFGRCAAPGCGRAFFDSTANHSKRFCSARCATRTNVAAYRRRQADQ